MNLLKRVAHLHASHYRIERNARVFHSYTAIAVLMERYFIGKNKVPIHKRSLTV